MGIFQSKDWYGDNMVKRGDRVIVDNKQGLIQEIFQRNDGRYALKVMLPDGSLKILTEGDDDILLMRG